jgi:hypothetical protein
MRLKRRLKSTMSATAGTKEDINPGARIIGSGITSSARFARDVESHSVDMRTLSGLRFVYTADKSFSQKQSLPMNPEVGGPIT